MEVTVSDWMMMSVAIIVNATADRVTDIITEWAAMRRHRRRRHSHRVDIDNPAHLAVNRPSLFVWHWPIRLLCKRIRPPNA